ncbi:nuclear transport factor 2 family protein [Dyella mobilis]|uniref:Nuclear transport factor 2 family protein n=1 Tax=Dyella mobilis TaxID=1849582 RepID=A0ABS2KM70_9GAMM|nr:nuclear transport factor 2 family protein [Dyella mobilis]MBM7132256.1 nuclear transport factor 2 family protein [Dyella mobilis]GLQ95758.1 hypothetical protein GCM10007863_01760 [Dyella mobilis]
MTIFAHRLSWISTAVLVALIAIFLHAQAMDAQAQDAMNAPSDETQHSEAAVMAVDQHWSIAELSGNTAWLDQMLLPEYRSIGDTGMAHDKQAIIANAATRKGTDLAKAQQQMETYRQEHPYGSAVTIRGDTAVVTFYDLKLGPQKGVRSSDIFVYVDGHWHAMYSQHTSLHS